MDILVTKYGRAMVRISAKDIYASPVWNVYESQCNKVTAYFDIVFQADEFGHLKTTIYDLAERWRVTSQTARNWLRWMDENGVLIVDHDRIYWYITLVFEPLRPKERYPKKTSECRYPHKYDCKDCEYNLIPELSDGGCRLMHKSAKDMEKGGSNATY